MALPTSRNTTYAPSSPILSADLNALQDMITGNKHPLREVPLAAAAWTMEAGGTTSLGDGRWTIGALSILAVSIPVFVGERVRNVNLIHNRAGAGTITMTLCKRILDVKTVLGTLAIVAGAAFASLQFAADPNYVVEAGAEVYLRVQCDSVGHIIHHAAALVDNL